MNCNGFLIGYTGKKVILGLGLVSILKKEKNEDNLINSF